MRMVGILSVVFIVLCLALFLLLTNFYPSEGQDTLEATNGSEELTSQGLETTMVERTIQPLPDTGGPK